MQKLILVLVVFLIKVPLFSQSLASTKSSQKGSNNSIILEPYTYTNHFKTRDLGAWASYPLWQDNAYDQNFQVKQFIPGIRILSIVQKVTPYSTCR